MLTLDMVREAQEALRGIARRTPLDRAPKFGENVYIKAENLQLTGAFKLRGAYNKIRSLTPEEAARGVIACSAGNHAQGIALFILSNSRKPGRAQNFAQALGVPFQGRSGKPRRRGYLQAMERMGCTPAQTAMVGDQIFTDTLGANNAGVTPLLVEPIQLAGNPGRYLRYAAETPFRLLGKRRPFL